MPSYPAIPVSAAVLCPALVCALLCALPASAEGPAAPSLPTIAVVGIHQASLGMPDQQRTVAEWAAAIEGTGRFDALILSDVALAIKGRENIIVEEGMLGAPRLALAAGKNAYNLANPEDAITSLETAIDGYRGAFAGAFNVEEVWDAWVHIGAAQLQRDPPNETAARAAFGSAVTLSPSRPLNPALFPPHVIEAYVEVEQKLTTEGVALEVSADGPAIVRLDGVERGSTPITIQNVFPGEHFLVARGTGTEGGVGAFARLDLPTPGPGMTASRSVMLALGPPVVGEAAASLVARSAQVTDLYTSLGRRATGVDYVLVVGIVDAAVSLQLLDVAKATFSKPIELPFAGAADDEVTQALPLLLNGVGTGGTFTATAPAPAPIDIGDNVALALLLNGRIAGTQAGPVAPAQPVRPQRRGVGTVLAILGGVAVASAAGTGGYLLVQSTQNPPTPMPANQGVLIVRFE